MPGPGPRRAFLEGEDWATLVTSEEDRRRGLLTRSITSFRKVGDLYRRDHEVHRQRILTRAELASQLRSMGFRVRTIRGYGPKEFGPGHAGFIAQAVGIRGYYHDEIDLTTKHAEPNERPGRHLFGGAEAGGGDRCRRHPTGLDRRDASSS